MLIKFLFFVVLLSSVASYSQSYIGAGGAIPDYTIGRVYYLNVAGLDSININSNYGLKSVCIDITHPRVAQLGVTLLAPDGTLVELTSGAGGQGADYIQTCFDMAASTTIISGRAPFTGTYYPRHNLGEVNNNQAGAGIWKLVVQDVIKGDTGTLNSWSISFGYQAPAPSGTITGICNQFNAGGCSCADTTQRSCWLLPDMMIGDTWFRDSIHRQEYRDSITVSNSNANIGYGPMEIQGTGIWYCGDSIVSSSGLCPSGGYARQLVKQRIYIKTAAGFFDYLDTAVGTMSYHAELGHRHLHVDDWTENTLRIRGPEADPSRWPVVGRGYKNSMNLYDHVKCDSVFYACDYQQRVYERDKLPNGGLGLGYNSGSATIQGISVGYADIYEYLLPYGQAIYFDSLCNGDYILMAEYDPLHRFLDMRSENNINYFPITLHQQQSSCCKAVIAIDTLDYHQGTFRFIDRSKPMPNSWVWTFGDGDSSREQFPVHQYHSGGFYTVYLRTINRQGCVAHDSLTLYVPTSAGIEPLGDSQIGDFTLSPNPNNGSMTLQIKSRNINTNQIQIINMLGQRIPLIIEGIDEDRYKIQVDRKGIFLVLLTTQTSTIIKKMVIE